MIPTIRFLLIALCIHIQIHLIYAQCTKVPTFTPVYYPICLGQSFSPLPTTSNNGITGTWSPPINNLETTTYTFTPAGYFSVASGFVHISSIKTDGTLWASTSGNFIQIGTDNDWKTISCGYLAFTEAIKTDGTLWAWGENSTGQLGDGTTTEKKSPIQIGTASDWKSVSCGAQHTIGIKTDGTLWAWGLNIYGQLGDGTTTICTSPKQIGTDMSWKSVASGRYHNVAIKTDGSLWAWGYNGSGQLGDGTYDDKTIPVQIGTLTDWNLVNCGSDNSVAIKIDGTLFAWGSNYRGQLGDGTTIDKTTPIQIGTATDWKSVSCGYQHTIGIKTDGTSWAWGSNSSGQLGNGSWSYTPTTSPEQIGTDSDWKSFTCSNEHTLAIKPNGTLWAWGNNNYGQLDGSTGTILSPKQFICSPSTTMAITVQDCSTTSLNGSISFNEAKIYSYDKVVYVQSKTTLENVSIFNSTGFVVYKGESTTIDLSENPTGIYMIILKTIQGLSNHKVIIE